ncbi:hypothetical protein [Streptomyces sp. NPDC089919]|uniref:hypothetical protein n=1 Tax=Streptomyces sp. NPDC089919 TaxID=3155188 RepID=UPI003414A785
MAVRRRGGIVRRRLQSDGTADTAPTSTRPVASRSAAAPDDGAAAEAVLQRAFADREALGGGRGHLEPQFDNTLPAVPNDVVSVTFAFTCTSPAKVLLKVTLDNNPIPGAEKSLSCGNSVSQVSFDVTKDRLIGFNAEVTGPHNGGFAYAYYAEKTQPAS